MRTVIAAIVIGVALAVLKDQLGETDFREILELLGFVFVSYIVIRLGVAWMGHRP